MDVYCLLAVGFLVYQSIPAQSKVYRFSTKVRTISSFASSCNFLCYSGILSTSDGCVCHLNMCTPSSCGPRERCQTKLIGGKGVATCCPKYKHHACDNQPRFHARRGRRLFYFRRETQRCRRFVPTMYDSAVYFRSHLDCARSCTCRRASRRRYREH